MTFKANWEKASAEHLPQGMVEQMVRLAYPEENLLSYEVIKGGCANLNIKVYLEKKEAPLILRVYLRDHEACYREQKLGQLLKGTIPIPYVYYIGESDGYYFAVSEFMPGIPLRDLLLGDLPHDLTAVMYEVGTVLSQIASYTFPKPGFFDQELNIAHELTDDFAIHFAKKCLQNENVASLLTIETCSQIRECLDQYGRFFPNSKENHLVHADFDPANILVDQIAGVWKIRGILDWEFAFSGSTLCDVANMLRYAHKMPSEFQDAFLQGLTDGGVTLPQNWQISVHMLNLLSLLDCLKRSDPQKRPNQCADIQDLIDHLLAEINRIRGV
jgi:aminoglycoside phosphotransferase (APT) family kinase protein